MERTIPYQCNIIYYEIKFMCYLGRITGPVFEVELEVVLVLIFYQYLVNEVPLDGANDDVTDAQKFINVGHNKQTWKLSFIFNRS